MKRIHRNRLICLLLCIATVVGLLAGCNLVPAPTQPETTNETTTVATTTEATVPTTEYIPLPLELDTPVEEALFTAEETFPVTGAIDPAYTLTVCGEEVVPGPDGNSPMKPSWKRAKTRSPWHIWKKPSPIP